MLKKYFTLILTVLIINLSLSASAFAETKAEKETKFADKVKQNVIKLGTGKEAKVKVKLKDGTKLKGYIGSINEGSFVVIDENTQMPTEVPYPQTKNIKGWNSEGVIIALAIAGVVVGIIAIMAYYRR